MATDYASMEFDGQRKGEKVVLIFRRHRFTTWRGFWWGTVFATVGAIPMLIWRENSSLFFVWLGFLGVGILYFCYIQLLWYFSYYLVTNQRIRQIRQTSLFRKTVVDLNLDKIQSISYQIPNFGGSVFNFGTILIQTQAGNMTISTAENPEENYNILQDQVN